MAVDWLAKNLYILDVELKQIIVCSLQRDACTLLSRNISYGSLRSVAVDPATGYNFSLFIASLRTVKQLIKIVVLGIVKERRIVCCFQL